MTAPSYSSGLGVHITCSKRTCMIAIYTGTILTFLNFSITLCLFCCRIIQDLKGSIYASIYLVFCLPHHCFLNWNKNSLRTGIQIDSCALLFPSHLDQCLVHNKHSIHFVECINVDDIKMNKTSTYSLIENIYNKNFSTRTRVSKDEIRSFQQGNQERFQRESSNRTSLGRRLRIFQGRNVFLFYLSG